MYVRLNLYILFLETNENFFQKKNDDVCIQAVINCIDFCAMCNI